MYIYIQYGIQKYIVEIHTSNIIIEKNHKADINSTGFIFQSSGMVYTVYVSSYQTSSMKFKEIQSLTLLQIYLLGDSSYLFGKYNLGSGWMS